MPEGEFSADPIQDDIPMDPLPDFDPISEPEVPDVADIPSVTLSDVDQYVLCLVSSSGETQARAKSRIDYDANGRAAVKRLISLGLIGSDVGGYTVTDDGLAVMVSNGLIDSAESTELTPHGEIALQQYS